MRICFVLDFPVTNTGGVVYSTINQIKALQQAGHTVYIFANQAIDNVNSFVLKPSLTINLPNTIFILPGYINSKKRQEVIRQLLTKNKIECVWLQSELSLALIVQDVARELNIPVIFTVHSIFWQIDKLPLSRVAAFAIRQALHWLCKRPIYIQPKTTGTLIERLLKSLTLNVASASDAVVSPSQHQLETLRSLDRNLPLYNIPNPFLPAGASLSPAHTISSISPNEPLRILWVGRLTPEKRPLEFLEALSQCPSEFIQCTMIGDGILLKEMRRRYGKLPHVLIAGPKTNNETIAAIDQSHLVALTSYHFDNQPMVVAEAISRHRPVLYCDERLTAEGLKEAGILTANSSPEAITQTIKQLAGSPEQIIKLSRAAAKAKTVFDAKSYAKKAEKLIVGLLKNRK